MSVSLKIKIFDSKGTQVLQVAKSSLTIGSAPHCDVVLVHPSVGAEHARAWLEGGRIWIQDLATPSGTTLNDIRLPSLKPMLLRDLDVLRLGESEATLGLEPLLVRAPVVKSQASLIPEAAGEAKAAPKDQARDMEAEKRREELRALGRELADLRLQLQMGRLEKNSTEEMNQQLKNLRDEIKTVQEQKQKWSETLRQMELEKQHQRKEGETEQLTERLRAEKALKEWKQLALKELSQLAKSQASRHAKNWATRPLTSEMIGEWETDLNSLFRKVILNEDLPRVVPELPALPDVTLVIPVCAPPPLEPAVPLVKRASPVESHTVKDLGQDNINEFLAAAPPVKKERRKPRRPLPKSMPWKTVSLTSVLLAVGIGLTWWAVNLFRQHGARSFSSTGAPLADHERKVPTRFVPKQNRKFRNTYTENVLYLENYVAAEQNRDFSGLWQTELGKVAANEWKSDPFVISPVLTKERALIADLSRIKDSMMSDREQEGIAQMKTRETLFLRELETILKSRPAVDRFLKFKRGFYVRNQSYLSRESN